MNKPDDITNRELSKQIGDLRKDVDHIRKDVDSINSALYGTGNPHGGLFGKFEGLEAKIDGVKETLITKIDGVNEKFDKMFSFAKWAVGVAAVPICAVAVPIFIEVVLPIIRKWTGG